MNNKSNIQRQAISRNEEHIIEAKFKINATKKDPIIMNPITKTTNKNPFTFSESSESLDLVPSLSMDNYMASKLPLSVPNSPLLRQRSHGIKPRELSGQFIYPITIKVDDNNPNKIEIVKLAQTAKEQNYGVVKNPRNQILESAVPGSSRSPDPVGSKSPVPSCRSSVLSEGGCVSPAHVRGKRKAPDPPRYATSPGGLSSISSSSSSSSKKLSRKKVRAPSPPPVANSLYAVPNKKSPKGKNPFLDTIPDTANKNVFHSGVQNIQKGMESLAVNKENKIIDVQANLIHEDKEEESVDVMIDNLEKTNADDWVLENGKLLPARSESRQGLAASTEDVKVNNFN